MCIQKIARSLCGHVIVEPPAPEPLEWWEVNKPTGDERISGVEIRTILHKKFPEAIINMGDRWYTLPSYDDIAFFVAQDQTNKFEYVADDELISSYDCNRFATRLHGEFSVPGWADLTFGKAWTDQPDTHALNWFIDEERNFWWLEPQSDAITARLSDTEDTVVRFMEC